MNRAGAKPMPATTTDARPATTEMRPSRPDEAPPSRGDGGDLDGAGLHVLDRSDCLQLVARGSVGRIAVTAGALPMILPVRYTLDGDRVVLCVGVGSTLDQATHNAVVAFEVDGSDLGGEWSVSIVGIAQPIPEGDESDRAEGLPLPRWWLGRPHRFVSVSTEHMTGRRAPAWP
jgi:nitroimidazol reductase NimA-like FMN-containing flavoprotein (pyridoxamine 5'-phosphate oxidase superfamily)